MLMGTGPSNANLDYLANTMDDVNKILSDQPEVQFAQVFTGVPNSNQAFGIASMVPWSQREASQATVTNRVGTLVQDIPGMAVTAFQMPELPGAGSGLPIQFVITTPSNFESLFTIATDVLTEVKANPMFVYSDLDLNFDSATMKINIDKDKSRCLRRDHARYWHHAQHHDGRRLCQPYRPQRPLLRSDPASGT